MKENLQMEKEMEMEKNIMKINYQYLKVFILMEKDGMEKEKNMIKEEN